MFIKPFSWSLRTCLFLFLLCVFIILGVIHELPNIVKDPKIFYIQEVRNGTKSLEYIYENYHGTHWFSHWKEYATHYDFHLTQILHNLAKSKRFRMLEIGVASGGSVEVWRSYFSSQDFYYVGMDIIKRCKRSEDINQNIFRFITSIVPKSRKYL